MCSTNCSGFIDLLQHIPAAEDLGRGDTGRFGVQWCCHSREWLKLWFKVMKTPASPSGLFP